MTTESRPPRRRALEPFIHQRDDPLLVVEEEVRPPPASRILVMCSRSAPVR